METSNLDFTLKGLYIGGDWQESATGKTFETINLSTGDNLGDVPMADAADVDCAVAAATIAFADWSRTPIQEWADLLEKFAARIRELRDEIGLMDSLDVGNTLSGMKDDVDWSADSYRYFAGLIKSGKGGNIL